MSTIAQQKLRRAIAARGERSVGHATGLSERRLRDIASGVAAPRASTRKRLEDALEIEPDDWSSTPEAVDLDALDRAEPAAGEAPGLIERLTTIYLDPEVSWTDRTRAASIVLRLAGSLPPTPSWAARLRFHNFAAELMAADEALADITEQHEDAMAGVRTSPVDDIFEWARVEASHPGVPARAVVALHALEARAGKAVHAVGEGAPDRVHALAVDIVKAFTPLTPAVASVFERYGLEPRPLAPAHFNVNYPLYQRTCEERGWRPREQNAVPGA